MLYVALWQVEAPFWEWAVASILLGLGFTFFSGAVEAWLVDALAATGFDGELETVFGRGQIVSGIAMLTGSVAGGLIAQATSLGVPFVVRAGVLVVMFVVAWRLMHDVGFTPAKGERPLAEMRKIASDSIEYGWRVPAVKWLMLASLFSGGVGIYAFYALQPYLLELYGDPTAYSVAGLVAAIVAGAQILGGIAAPRIRRLFRRRTSALLGMSALGVGALALIGVIESIRGGDRADRGLGPAVRGRDADPPGLHQRDDPVEAAGDDPLLRLADELHRRRLGPAGPRPRGRRLGLRALVPAQRRDRGAGAAVHLALAPRARRRPTRWSARRREAGAQDGARPSTATPPRPPSPGA